jgi:FkbM family methyltransferase
MNFADVARGATIATLRAFSDEKQAAGNFDFLSWTRERFGNGAGLRLWLSGSKIEGIAERVVRVPLPTQYGDRSVSLRIGTTDIEVYRQVFDAQEYAFEVAPAPEFVIDAGGHLGMTSMYFAMKWPNAQIVTIEPDRCNWTLARRNLAPYKNVTLIRGALWPRDAHLGIGNPDASPWGYRMVEDLGATFAGAPDNGLSVPGFTFERLLRHFGRERADVFKLDIEGSEVDVLPTVDMSRVGIFACEVHDHKQPGCMDAMLKASPGWNEHVHGTTHIRRRP